MPKQRRTQPTRPARKPATKTAAKARPKAAVAKGTKARPPARKANPAAKATARRASAGAKPQPRRPTPKAHGAKTGRPATAATRGALATPTKAVAVAAGPSLHELAVETFERGFQALQKRDFGRAAEFLTEVINEYSDEKELQERARVYLSICERQRAGHGSTPRSLEEKINAATVAINRGAFADGLALLRKLESEHGDNDHVQYMLCVAYTVQGDFAHALGHLKQAIALNHENRYLATQDADLDPLRQEPSFFSVLDTPPAKPKAAARKR